MIYYKQSWPSNGIAISNSLKVKVLIVKKYTTRFYGLVGNYSRSECFGCNGSGILIDHKMCNYKFTGCRLKTFTKC